MAKHKSSQSPRKTAHPKKKNKKIIRYKRPLNINIGMIIFALIFVYMVFSVSVYLSRDKIQFYEVQDGSIVNNKEYTGIIMRKETVKNADRSGYLNYYVREGKRASVGTRVYSIDETGSISTLLEKKAGDSISLKKEDISNLKKQLTSFSLAYNHNNFQSVYDTKYSLEGEVLEYMNFNALDNLDSMMDKAGIEKVTTDKSGIISYEIDSYKNLQTSGISEDVFNWDNYKKNFKKSGDLVEKDTPVYKIITSDLWSVVFPLSEDDKNEYIDKKALTVVFRDNNLKATGNFSIFTGADGKTYGKIDFDKYMIQFASQRYADFEIVTDKVNGLKIPVTAVCKKDFYLIPVDYITKGGDSSEKGFHKEVYSESGTSVVFVPVTIYCSKGDNYYIAMNQENGLKSGDYIVKPDSLERYQIGDSDSLQGVYSINKGYALFKQINILTSNDEYYIVKKNVSYSLSVYDHIVLNAASVNDGQLIYK
jgi:hypothetical protein